MRRSGLIWLACIVLAATASGQQIGGRQVGPAALNPRKDALEGMAKLRYLVKQINLAAAQVPQVEELFKEYDSTHDPRFDNDMRVARENLKAAIDAKNTSKIEKMRDLVRDLEEHDPMRVAEKTFMARLGELITPEQRDALAAATARLARVPSGALRPIDVIEAAYAVGLSPDQQQKLNEALGDVRKSLEPGIFNDPGKRALLVHRVTRRVRPVLSDAQAAQFDATLERLRPPGAAAVDDAAVAAEEERVRNRQQAKKPKPVSPKGETEALSP